MAVIRSPGRTPASKAYPSNADTTVMLSRSTPPPLFPPPPFPPPSGTPFLDESLFFWSCCCWFCDCVPPFGCAAPFEGGGASAPVFPGAAGASTRGIIGKGEGEGKGKGEAKGYGKGKGWVKGKGVDKGMGKGMGKGMHKGKG